MTRKEPKFMKRLHKIREALYAEWRRESETKMLESLHRSGERIRASNVPKKDKAA